MPVGGLKVNVGQIGIYEEEEGRNSNGSERREFI
jgi:hypothetical protein